jgi:acetylornithine deacetylase/succinyl-diaminopimelate desuccinylase-like protein
VDDDSLHIQPDQLVSDLHTLCAQPSSNGQPDELAQTARLVVDMVRRAGLQAKLVRTAGAPIVLGWRAGQCATRVLLYHHYDVTPPGPWRAWFHEPFQLAEREQVLYGRGVAHGKGPLVAHLQAIRALLNSAQGLPCGVALVIEGEGLSGSPHLADVVRQYPERLRADGCLSTAGERDLTGQPICYSGSKGLLRVLLRVRGAHYALPAGAATSVPNPAWRLAWALNNIKGEDEDIRINGFYDSISGPERSERDLLRQVRLDEPGRLEAWGIPSFLFNIQGAALTRSEVTLPTCNIASFTVESAPGIQCIPTAAAAQLDFQLVPHQQPDAILALLHKHLAERGMSDVEIEALPGMYAPVRSDADQPFIQQLLATGEQTDGGALPTLPLGTFAQPLHIFAAEYGIPVAALALARQNSAIHGPNEQIPLDDLLHHARTLANLLSARQAQQQQAAVHS